MIVDFRKLSDSLSAKFIADKNSVMKDYEIISSKLLSISNTLPWLISNPTSRNIFHSKFFYYLRCQRLLNDISSNELIDKVFTDDKILYKLLKQKYNTHFVGTSRFRPKLMDLLHCVKWSFYAIFCKSNQRRTILKKSRKVTIIEAYFPKENSKYNDRYYGEVLDRIPADFERNIFYNFIYLPIPHKKKIEDIDRNTHHNIIYMWDFLKPTDYLRALFLLFNYREKKYLNINYLGINQKPMLEYIYKDNKKFYYYVAFLYERLIYRMKKADIDIKLYIDWFENQAIDKSLSWGMCKYYPQVKVHSYIGFMPDISDNPITIATNVEYKQHIAPKNIFVCNQALKDKYIASNYKGIVEIAPFYRAENIWHVQSSAERYDKFTILVPMGLMPTEVETKINFFVDFKRNNPNFPIMIYLKPHPVYNAKSISSLIQGIDGISIVGGSIYDYLVKVDAVVASNSTTTYEALALGKPLLYYINSSGTLSLSKPDKVPDSMWLRIKDFDTLKHAINIIQNTDRNFYDHESEKLKAYYFTKETEELNMKLFDIN